MTKVCKDKYRGTPIYHHVMSELVRAAQYRGVTTYQDLAVIMGLALSGSHMGKETGQVLGEIAEDEHLADRPMLSAVAVGVSGKPGPGFYSLAHQLGCIKSAAEDLPFWRQQLDLVHETWRRPLHKPEAK